MDYSIRTRIPLRHFKDASRVTVTIQNDFRSDLFRTSETFPLFITEISSQKISNLDIKIGDYIVFVNGKNLSRASGKSLRDIIK